MPDIHASTIGQVILLAREMQQATQIGAHDGVRDATAGSLAAQEFAAFVSGLNEEQQYSLVAVMWIGRGSFDAAEFDEAYITAQQEAVNSTEQYLQGVPLLADHLEAGLEALGIDPGEVEDDLL